MLKIEDVDFLLRNLIEMNPRHIFCLKVLMNSDGWFAFFSFKIFKATRFYLKTRPIFVCPEGKTCVEKTTVCFHR